MQRLIKGSILLTSMKYLAIPVLLLLKLLQLFRNLSQKGCVGSDEKIIVNPTINTALQQEKYLKVYVSVTVSPTLVLILSIPMITLPR